MTQANRRVLVVAPHPDDESLGCGGTIKLLTTAKSTVDLCFLTRGELGTEVPVSSGDTGGSSLAETRSAEALAAAEILGANQTIFLEGVDGRLGDHPEVARRLAELLRGPQQYQQVFVPWYHERHPDHRAAFLMFQDALHSAPAVSSIWLYEVWSPLMPNNFVPIDRTIDAKRRAIEAHHSQLKCLNYVDAFLGLATYRALSCPPSQYAEAFIVLDREATLQLR